MDSPRSERPPRVKSRIDQLAVHLLREGHVDNEADARLAAVHIILACGRADESSRDNDNDNDGDAAVHARQFTAVERATRIELA
jgi:hypothetical protein